MWIIGQILCYLHFCQFFPYKNSRSHSVQNSTLPYHSYRTLWQGCPILLMKGNLPAEFCTNTPAWKVLVILNTLINWFRCVSFWLELNFTGRWPSRSRDTVSTASTVCTVCWCMLHSTVSDSFHARKNSIHLHIKKKHNLQRSVLLNNILTA